MFTFRHSHRNHVGGLVASAARFGPPGYSAHYGQTAQPTPAAMSYAYESLALIPYPPSGPSIAVRDPIKATAKPLYVLQSIPMVGLPTVAGQLVGQPLFNPYGGYSGPSPLPINVMPPNIVDPAQAAGML